ncbi:MAG: 1-deoxy-D-xylulose-5-phosphate synthase, partial [Bacillales bacterium]|nr:1-deoxy-D-xylulose-5-phosphate synthase [Bacillales bacterium]
MININDIKNPAFLKDLSLKEKKELATQIRETIYNKVSKDGGHLSSNLGVVELTIALHTVFNCPEDKILFDVSHQSYTHKILTGRVQQFNSSLRAFKGLSGYQKHSESVYDPYDSGHSSTSISHAEGLAITRDLNRENYQIIAVIGDGALSNGLAFEALNNLSELNSKIIVVINDNDMSISKPVGGLGKMMSSIRKSI